MFPNCLNITHKSEIRFIVITPVKMKTPFWVYWSFKDITTGKLEGMDGLLCLYVITM